jgi:hypothetical protein
MQPETGILILTINVCRHQKVSAPPLHTIVHKMSIMPLCYCLLPKDLCFNTTIWTSWLIREDDASQGKFETGLEGCSPVQDVLLISSWMDHSKLAGYWHLYVPKSPTAPWLYLQNSNDGVGIDPPTLRSCISQISYKPLILFLLYQIWCVWLNLT